MLLLSLLIFALSGCSLVVPNVKICADKGKFGAVCAYTRDAKKKKIQVSKQEWDRERIGQFCMDAEGLGKYQTFIEKACQQNKNCVDEIQQFVKTLKEK